MSDFLSQEEIDALLRGAAAPDEQAKGNEGQDSNDPDDWPARMASKILTEKRTTSARSKETP